MDDKTSCQATVRSSSAAQPVWQPDASWPSGRSSCFGCWVEVPTASSFAGPRLESGESPNSEPHCGAQAQTPRTTSYGVDCMLRPVVGVYSLRLRASALRPGWLATRRSAKLYTCRYEFLFRSAIASLS